MSITTNVQVMTGYNNLLLTDNNGEIKNMGFPTGMVIIWSGTRQNVPRGWGLCDGTKGTPDLRGQFVRMYSDSRTDQLSVDYKKQYAGVSRDDQNTQIYKHSINDRGGSDNRILTIKEFPQHEHNISFGNVSDWGDSNFSWADGSPGRSPICDDSEFPLQTRVPNTNKTGSVTPNKINNQPPYYVLSFIMKLDVSQELENKQNPLDLLPENNNLILSNNIGKQISIGFPRGMIVIWNTKNNIPRGWALCDGKSDNKTGIAIPDLRGQFVRMYSDDLTNDKRTEIEKIQVSYGDEKAGISRDNKKREIYVHRIGDRGGSDIIVSNNIFEIPSHDHKIDWGQAKKWGTSSGTYTSATGRNLIVNGRDGRRPFPDNTKIDSVGLEYPYPQNNQPPYYVLAFIMKL